MLSAQQPDPTPATALRQGTAFEQVMVTITKQEHIGLLMQANYWKSMHQRALVRIAGLQARNQQQLELSALTEATLRSELEHEKAKVRDLQKRLFGRKSERHQTSERQIKTGTSKAHRGQQDGKRGHGRTLQPHLPARDETIALNNACCPDCRKPFLAFPGTEDSEVLEIEVKAYRRKIHRQRYKPACQCKNLPGIITAPAPTRLIARGKFGISVWSTVLLDKFLYGRPSHRLLQDFADHGLNMSAGTLAGGLHSIAQLFKPLDIALRTKLCSESHWHADETRWAVFTEIEGKIGHRWYLWVFHSKSVVHYVLDQTRATKVIEGELDMVVSGIISCDRYSAYKCFARLHPGVILAFCWVHQRRDFLELANAHPDLRAWAFVWLDAIANLYHLNKQRLQTEVGSAPRLTSQAALECAVEGMVQRRYTSLADLELPTPAVKVLQSMQVHWTGLTVFVAHPEIPMDNNVAERDMRTPVVGRKNFFGSGSEWSGELAATMYSLFATLKIYGINARTWLVTYLQACADNGNAAPVNLNAFLPWMMDDKRLAFMRAALGYQGQGQKQNGSTERAEVAPTATTAPTLDIETIDSS
jgi:transposase